jgi:small conductance mechanosensitive channel
VFFDLNERIKTRFDEVGIEIPFPQMDIHSDKAA